MSQFLVLSHINVQNANSIAGLTWGFPALTHFLGFTHALSRKIASNYAETYKTELNGCAVVSHHIQNKVYQPKKYADFEFLQNKNPPVLAKHKSVSPPIIEEGKMNLTVSLVIELKDSLALTTQQVEQFESDIGELCEHMRLAGGSIVNIAKVKLLTGTTTEQKKTMLRQIKRLTMPGFVLLDRSDDLAAHHQTLSDINNSTEPTQLLDAWLDFSALKYKAEPKLVKGQTEADENTEAEWVYQPKPRAGYLVPLMAGYKAISEPYDPGEVLNTRDSKTKTRFVEAVHTVGEWQGVHRIASIQETIWRYQHDGQWYLCTQKNKTSSMANVDAILSTVDENQLNNLNDVLNLLGI